MEASKLEVIIKKIDRVSEWSGKLFSFLVVPLTCLIVFEVISRAMNAPTIWSFELSNFLFGAHFMLVAAYGLLHGSHVHIDLLVGRLSKRTQALITIINYLLVFFPFVLVILGYGIIYAIESWSMWERSWSTWGPPLYPIKTVIPLTAFLLLIQGIAEFIKTVEAWKNEGVEP
ncbi:MAG: TRAP transporter small permease subunit [Smithellaceae bacterium]|nr:TRAP transporter small permease subunit [Smithellaceae bacterium]